MYKNKMLSVAAATILTSTAAFAFDTISDAGIIETNNGNTSYTGGYVGGIMPGAELLKSATQYGDALIYPAFETSGDWETEIAIRNTSNTRSVVSKVVLYSATDSEELLDFNVYLSDEDVFKFKIAGGIVYTTDYSVPSRVSEQHIDNDSVTMNNINYTPGFELPDDVNLEIVPGMYIFNRVLDGKYIPLKDQGGNYITSGYAMAFGMIQESDIHDNDGDLLNDGASKYHRNHSALYLDYRNSLDDCRGAGDMGAANSWRNAYIPGTTNLMNGMMTDSNANTYASPNVLSGCAENNATTLASSYHFESVDSDVLVGSVRITNSQSESRDMLLPALALANFTADNQMLLWSEGEYASIADRNINAGAYDHDAIIADSTIFAISSANLAFNENHDEETQLIVTQPYKRIKVQMVNAADIAATFEYFNYADIINPNATSNIYKASSYGYFTMSLSPYDEEEQGVTIPGGNGALTSPYNGAAANIVKYVNELQVVTLTNLLAQARANGFDAKEGHVEFTFNGTMSAIVTQMNGSRTTGDAQTNWTYTPTK